MLNMEADGQDLDKIMSLTLNRLNYPGAPRNTFYIVTQNTHIPKQKFHDQYLPLLTTCHGIYFVFCSVYSLRTKSVNFESH